MAVVAGACGGGGGDDERTASLIHRLLQAASGDDTSELESFPGRLPEGLPVEPPRYPDAELIVSSRQPAPVDLGQTPDASGQVPQPMLYFIVLDTGDGRTDVFEYYQDALDKEPWQLESTFSTQELDTLQFVNVSDADVSGVVSIARGGDDGRTSILISLQDAGAFREELPPFERGDSLPLPDEFPQDIPMVRRGTITGTAFFREPGNESFLLVLLTEDRPDAVLEFYRTGLQDLGWTVQAGAPLGVEERLDFRDEAGEIQGDILVERFARDPSYTEVRVQIRQAPGRQPEETPEATPAD